MRSIAKRKSWLLPAVLILFILEVFTLPFVLGITYSGRSESPNHVLTYTENKLTWDSATGIDENGVAELSLFNSIYRNVQAQNDEKVVAPGTDGSNIVRLKNSVSGSVTYTAVLYELKSNPDVAVEAGLTAEGAADTDSCALPDGVKAENMIRAVTGTIGSGQIQDFDIRWMWNYYADEQQDVIDTALGDKSESDDVTVGLYITVEDNNSYVTPEPPQTGNNTDLGMYVGLMVVSALILLFLFISRRRERKCEE